MTCEGAMLQLATETRPAALNLSAKRLEPFRPVRGGLRSKMDLTELCQQLVNAMFDHGDRIEIQKVRLV